MEFRQGWKNLGANPPGEGAIFGGCSGHSKALAIFTAEFAAKGIIQFANNVV